MGHRTTQLRIPKVQIRTVNIRFVSSLVPISRLPTPLALPLQYNPFIHGYSVVNTEDRSRMDHKHTSPGGSLSLSSGLTCVAYMKLSHAIFTANICLRLLENLIEHNNDFLATMDSIPVKCLQSPIVCFTYEACTMTISEVITRKSLRCLLVICSHHVTLQVAVAAATPYSCSKSSASGKVDEPPLDFAKGGAAPRVRFNHAQYNPGLTHALDRKYPNFFTGFLTLRSYRFFVTKCEYPCLVDAWSGPVQGPELVLLRTDVGVDGSSQGDARDRLSNESRHWCWTIRYHRHATSKVDSISSLLQTDLASDESVSRTCKETDCEPDNIEMPENDVQGERILQNERRRWREQEREMGLTTRTLEIENDRLKQTGRRR
ncbi:hypothetical protein CBL_07727 [Carabus blaptoides fortunei]